MEIDVEKNPTKIKTNINKIKTKIKSNIEQIHYELKDAAPWYKYYEQLEIPKNIDYPKNTMYEVVEMTAKKYPENYAYEYFSKKVTYFEFIEKIERCAKSLQAIGVKEDSIVTLCMPNTPEGIIMFYACNMIGAVANMVHPLSSETEIEFCLNKAKSSHLLTMDFVYEKIYKIKDRVNLKKVILTSAADSMGVVTSIGYWVKAGRKIKVTNQQDNVIRWKDFIYLGRNIKEVNATRKRDRDLAVILYSGGTTGIPKGIMLSNSNFNVIAYQHHKVCHSVKPGESMLCIMPIFHGFGLGICFHTVLTAGMKAIIIPKFTPGEFGKLIKTYQPNFIAGVPTLYEALLNTEIKEDGLEFLTTILCGGDMLTPELQKKVNNFLKEHGCKSEIRVGYGMTECVASSVASPTGNLIPGSIGIPNPDNYVKIVKPGTTENLYYEDDGEICISGPSVMMGYLDDPKETKNTLKTHEDGRIWLHTGDMGCMDKTGVVYFKTRIKRMIISSGYNIYPNHVENVINSHPKVLTSIVVGVPHPYKGEVAKAYVVLKPEYKGNDKIDAEIMEHCKTNLAKYSWPTSIEYRETLPVTKLGKADYRNVK